MTEPDEDLNALNNEEALQHHQSSELTADAINEQLGEGIVLGNSKDEHIITALCGYPAPVPPTPTNPQNKSK